LAAAGYSPVVYDNLSRGNRWAVKWGPFEYGDIGDFSRLSQVLQIYKPAAIMHFAALAYVGESVEQPLLYYTNNVSATAMLLQAVVRYGPIPFVFSSTCATYGIPEQTPISEDHPQRPINPYGYSKLVVERMLRDAERAHGLRWIALRYFNAAGADPDGEIGEAHDPETHLIPLVIGAARDGVPLRIFGDDYKTADGSCIRDYIHVIDLADAHVAAAKYLLDGGASQALNLANAKGFSVKEVVRVVEQVSGVTVPIEIVSRREGDPAVLVGDARRAQQVLGWKPQKSDLEIQIRDAWNWEESRRQRN
jgi:UDP-arabinose 4-epimerase